LFTLDNIAADTHSSQIERLTPLVSPQLFIGGAIAFLCTVALRYDDWFVHKTAKGRRLREKFGERNAIWIWRSALATGIVFGLCLATGYVRPMTWNQ
jgi:hypothetical protein